MKPLVTNRRVLTWFCICPFDPNTSVLKKTFFGILTLFLFASALSGAISSIVFFVHNVSIDLENSLYSVLQIAANSNLSYLYLVAFFSREKISLFLATLEEIYQESK